MNVGRDRGRLLQELLVAEVLARRGEGPLARKSWARPRPREAVQQRAGTAERAVDAGRARAPKKSR
jgi:hypothetical protein